MKILRWLARYNKALVPLTMAIVYYLNSRYGWTIPLDETSANTIWMTIGAFITYLVPNVDYNKGE